MTALILQRMPIRTLLAFIDPADLRNPILVLILCFAGYLVLRISYAIMLKVIRHGSNRPSVNVVSLIVVPLTGYGVSLAAVWFFVLSGYLIMSDIFGPSVIRSTFFLILMAVLSTFSSLTIALIAGGVIADTNSRFKSVQAIIVGIAMVGLGLLYGYLRGHDYQGVPVWVRYVGYIEDGGIILFAFIGRHLLSDFAWK